MRRIGLRRGRHARWLAAIATLGVLAVGIGSSVFTVDVTEHALVSRFGALVRELHEPGLYFKWPVDQVIRLDKRLTFSRPGQAEYLTVDKHNVVVESLATWRIAEPRRFYAALRDRNEAESRLADVMLGEIGAVLGTAPASELIAPDRNLDRFRRIVVSIRERVAHTAQALYGIGIVDVELLHLTLPEQNREHVFDRMKAERDKMAKEYRTIGALEARKIIAQADRERTRIEAESSATAQRLRAEGDAEAARIYAAAFARDPAFYKFRRTLEAYGKFLDESTTVFLPAEAEVLRVLRVQKNPVPAGNLTTVRPHSRDGGAAAMAPAESSAQVTHSTERKAE